VTLRSEAHPDSTIVLQVLSHGAAHTAASEAELRAANIKAQDASERAAALELELAEEAGKRGQAEEAAAAAQAQLESLQTQHAALQQDLAQLGAQLQAAKDQATASAEEQRKLAASLTEEQAAKERMVAEVSRLQEQVRLQPDRLAGCDQVVASDEGHVSCHPQRLPASWHHQHQAGLDSA
jgi:chromosome segregation ATPase